MFRDARDEKSRSEVLSVVGAAGQLRTTTAVAHVLDLDGAFQLVAGEPDNGRIAHFHRTASSDDGATGATHELGVEGRVDAEAFAVLARSGQALASDGGIDSN